MASCFCTGRCWHGAPCPAFPHGRGEEPIPLGVGRTRREPLSEEDVRRIIREELARDREAKAGGS